MFMASTVVFFLKGCQNIHKLTAFRELVTAVKKQLLSSALHLLPNPDSEIHRRTLNTIKTESSFGRQIQNDACH